MATFEQTKTGNTGAFGWPLVSHPNFPNETILACPDCGSSNVSLSSSSFNDFAKGLGWNGAECDDCGTSVMEGVGYRGGQ